MSEKQPFKFDPVTGQPFTTQEAAQASLREQSLDRSKFSVVKVPNGWAIQDNNAAAELVMMANVPKPASPVCMRCFEIECAASSDTNATPHVEVTANGWKLVLQRAIPVIIPESHYRILCDAHRTKWVHSKDPSNPMRAEGKIMHTTFRVLRKPKGDGPDEQPDGVTEEDFLKQLGEGNAITNEYIERAKRAGP